MKLEELRQRWLTDGLLTQVRLEYITNAPPKGLSQREWYEGFVPKEIHPFAGDACADLRGVNFDGAQFSELGSFHYGRLDNASLVKTNINGTNFQYAVLSFADFSHSVLIDAVCSPVYAHQANFSNATLNHSFFCGMAPTRLGPANVTDLSEVNFQNCKATKTDFSSADFRHADMRGAQFIDCKFRNSDLRAIIFDEHTRFIRCDFHSAFMDEYLPYINAFRKGMYDTVQAPENMEHVNWLRGIGLPGT